MARTRATTTLEGRPVATRTATESLPGALLVPISTVRADPTQPRQDWDSTEAKRDLRALADSIREFGVLQPLVAREDKDVPDGPRYIVVAGGRRLAAAQMAGLPELPIVVLRAEGTRIRLLQLLENIQRRNLSEEEEGRAYKEVMDIEAISAEELGRRLGVSGQTVRNRMALLANVAVADAIRRGLITATGANKILRAPLVARNEMIRDLQSGNAMITGGVIDARIKRARQAEQAARAQNYFEGEGSPATADNQQITMRETTILPAEAAPEEVSPDTMRQQSAFEDVLEARRERSRILAATLAPALTHELHGAALDEVLGGLREILAAGDGAWALQLIGDVVARVDRPARF